MTSRETRQDSFQVGRDMVGMKSCGRLVKYHTFDIFANQVKPQTQTDPVNNATDPPITLTTDKTAPVEHPHYKKFLHRTLFMV